MGADAVLAPVVDRPEVDDLLHVSPAALDFEELPGQGGFRLGGAGAELSPISRERLHLPVLSRSTCWSCPRKSGSTSRLSRSVSWWTSPQIQSAAASLEDRLAPCSRPG